MSDIIRPADEDEMAAAIAAAAAQSRPLEVYGGGSKRDVGKPLQTAAHLSTSALTGITLYEPNELVISARSGTPLSEIEKTLATNKQQLAFEPIDLGPLLGKNPGQGTIGAVFATNLSGSRRIHVGAARDHLLGLRAVNGQGELFKSGGRVMKNVTGYDLCRGLAGSWGTLSVMSEVTMKVLPRAQATRTLILRGLTDEVAVDAMCAAMGSPFEVSGTVHLHPSCAQAMGIDGLAKRGQSVTALRLENFSSFLDYRAGQLGKILAAFGKMAQLDTKQSAPLWDGIRALKFLEGGQGAVWRISIAPTKAPQFVAAIAAQLECRAAYDWSGGLIWLELTPTHDAGASEIRRTVAEIGGYATLLRAEPAVRAAVDVFQPLDGSVDMLTRRIKAAFDPAGILNPGRMYSGI
ncbi:MAG: FAD-binding protein [Hyphomicrobiales bacterium]|nr:FAD-binding protein [Hyphomicrobiales bacterium]